MPNPQNVEPYGQLCHECAELGGPEAYKDHIASVFEEKGRMEGIAEARSQDLALAIGVYVVIDLAKFGWEHRREIKEFAIRTGSWVHLKGHELKEWAKYQRKRLIQ